MTTIFENVFSNETLDYFNNLPEVLTAKASLDAMGSGFVYFTAPITDEIRSALQSINVVAGTSIPMRWIKGDTAPHVDVGQSNFENTHLVYLNDSPGEIVIDNQSYSIQRNVGFVFNEGLSHKTQHTENIPRLLIGPMNERSC